MNGSDRVLTKLFLTDGGEISPQNSAEKTGYFYRTIHRMVDRLEGFIRHSYGKIEVKNDSAAQEMLKRVRSAEEQFRRTIGATAMQVVLGSRAGRSIVSKVPTRSAYVRPMSAVGSSLQVRYTPADRDEALEIAREAVTSYQQQYDDELGISGIWIKFEYPDGSTERFHLTNVFQLSKARVNVRRSRDNRPLDRTRRKLLEEREKLPRRMKSRSTLGG